MSLTPEEYEVLIFGGENVRLVVSTIPRSTPSNSAPITQALAALRGAGRHIEPQDIPGLWRVDGGPELTLGQVVDVARRSGLLPLPIITAGLAGTP